MTTPALTALAFAPIPVVAAAAVQDGWLQLGIGGAALFILYVILKPLVRAQVTATERLTLSMDSMSKTQAAALEVQRDLKSAVQASARAEERTAEALQALAARIEGGTAPAHGR